MTSTLSINVLGGLYISVDGRPAKMPPKALVLLGYLACRSAIPAAREVIADLLWPYQASEQSRHSLRSCLSEIRKAIGPCRESIEAGPFDCRLVGETSDIARLKELAAAGDCVSPVILDIYKGPLLDGVPIKSEPFDKWLSEERRRVDDMMLAALSRLAMRASSRGDHETAIRAARRAVEIDELNEQSHRQMIRVLENADRPADLARLSRWIHQTLRRELNIEPSEATTRLLVHHRGIVRAGDEIASLRSALSASVRREQELAGLLQEMLAVKRREAFVALRSRIRQALASREQKPAEAA